MESRPPGEVRATIRREHARDLNVPRRDLRNEESEPAKD
jgi:hypothetical protein